MRRIDSGETGFKESGGETEGVCPVLTGGGLWEETPV